MKQMLVPILLTAVWAAHAQSTNSQAFLCESIPTQMTLPLAAGAKFTSDAQVELINGAKETLDVTAMYWNLIASNTGNSTFTPAQFTQFGAGRGAAVYAAFAAAIKRGVKIRFLNGHGIESDNHTEAATLQSLGAPGQVEIQTWDAADWYKGGIMHQKIWIADRSSIYLGSANMDWLSLSQVKELGVAVHHNPTVAEDLGKLFERCVAGIGLSCSNSAPESGTLLCLTLASACLAGGGSGRRPH